MDKEKLKKEKERLEAMKSKIDKNIKILDDLLSQENLTQEQFRLQLAPWEDDVLWLVADIVRTSPIVNKNYPWGYDCDICSECGNKCTTDGDGWDCNWAFKDYFEREIVKRLKDRK